MSSAMMVGHFPPSSRAQGVKVLAQAIATERPTRVDPVKKTVPERERKRGKSQGTARKGKWRDEERVRTNLFPIDEAKVARRPPSLLQ